MLGFLRLLSLKYNNLEVINDCVGVVGRFYDFIFKWFKCFVLKMLCDTLRF